MVCSFKTSSVSSCRFANDESTDSVNSLSSSASDVFLRYGPLFLFFFCCLSIVTKISSYRIWFAIGTLTARSMRSAVVGDLGLTTDLRVGPGTRGDQRISRCKVLQLLPKYLFIWQLYNEINQDHVITNFRR